MCRADKNNIPENIGRLDDKLLARLASENAEKNEYTEELIKRYVPLIKKAAARFETDGYSRGDLESEAYFAAVKAISRYDEKKCSSFSAYMSVCITNRLISVLRKSYNTDNNTGSYDDIGDSVYDTATPETIVIAKEMNSEIAHILSAFEYNIFMYYVEGASYGEIAGRLKISPKSVDNAVQRIRRKLKKIYGGS